MNRILIVRTSSIGDVVMASALLAPLRKFRPLSHIAWLTEPPCADLIRCHPDLDAVQTWPKTRWRSLLKKGDVPALSKEVRAFLKRLKEQHFDTVIDAQGLLRSRLMAWATGARLRVGLASREPGSCLMNRVVPWDRNAPRISSEYASLLKALAVPLEAPFRPKLRLCPEDRLTAKKHLETAGVNNPFAVLCPFTTRPQKHWTADRWPRLAEALYDLSGLASIILGGPGDRAAAAEMTAGCRTPAFNLAGALSLGASAAVIERAALLVGVDTGLTHMGSAFSIPTVALFGSTFPYMVGPDERTRVLYEKMPCAPCRRRPTCSGAFTCMKALDVPMVAAAARQVLEKGAP